MSAFTFTTEGCPPGFIALSYNDTIDYICADHVSTLAYRRLTSNPIAITGLQYCMSFSGSRQQFDELLNLVSKQQSRNRPIAIDAKEEEKKDETTGLYVSGYACVHYMNLWSQQAVVPETARFTAEDLAAMRMVNTQAEAIALVEKNNHSLAGSLSFVRMIRAGHFSKTRYIDTLCIQRKIWDYYKNLKGEPVPGALEFIFGNPAAFLRVPAELAQILREYDFAGIADALEMNDDKYFIDYPLPVDNVNVPPVKKTNQ